MKKTTLLLITTIIGLSITIGCKKLAKKYGPVQEGGVESDTSAITTEKSYLAKLNQYRHAAQEKIIDQRKQLSDIEDRIKKDNPVNKAEYLAELENMKLTNSQLETKLQVFQPESQKQWETFRDEMIHDLEKINQSLTDLSAE